MNKITKYGWWVLIIVPLVLAFAVYVNNGSTIPAKEEPTITEWVTTEVNMEEIINNPTCPVEDVDWDIAVDALSKHYVNLKKQNPDKEIDGGPAEIERHFEENCEEDLKIYNKYISQIN